MTVTTDVTEDRVVVTREGRRLLEARLGHLEERVIHGLRATLADREDAWAMYEWEWGVEDGALLERLLGVAVVAEDRPGGTDAVQLGDAVTGAPRTPRSGSWSSIHSRRLWTACASACSPLARAVLGRHAGDRVDVASSRRTAVAVAGSVVVVVGLALLVLPGPGLLLLTAALPCSPPGSPGPGAG